MTADTHRAEQREAARLIAATAPPLTQAQRIRLAVLLRPDLPVGIQPVDRKPADT